MKHINVGVHIQFFLIKVCILWVENVSKCHLLFQIILNLARRMLMWNRLFRTLLGHEMGGPPPPAPA